MSPTTPVNKHQPQLLTTENTDAVLSEVEGAIVNRKLVLAKVGIVNCVV